MTTDAGKFSGAINWTELGAKFSDDPAFIADLLGVVIASNAEVPTVLRNAAGAGDIEQIARLAHRTKGMAGDLDAPPAMPSPAKSKPLHEPDAPRQPVLRSGWRTRWKPCSPRRRRASVADQRLR